MCDLLLPLPVKNLPVLNTHTLFLNEPHHIKERTNARRLYDLRCTYAYDIKLRRRTSAWFSELVRVGSGDNDTSRQIPPQTRKAGWPRACIIFINFATKKCDGYALTRPTSLSRQLETDRQEYRAREGGGGST